MTQLTFRLLAHVDFKPAPMARDHLRRLFFGLGDSRAVEKAHKVASGRQRLDQSPESMNTLRAYGELVRDSP
eukprot:10631395-Lingulodinium_polyedra.AAC.1